MTYKRTGPVKLYCDGQYIGFVTIGEKKLNLKEVIKVLSEVGKQSDTAKALRELEEVEKAVQYIKKTLSKRFQVVNRIKQLERKRVVERVIE